MIVGPSPQEADVVRAGASSHVGDELQVGQRETTLHAPESDESCFGVCASMLPARHISDAPGASSGSIARKPGGGQFARLGQEPVAMPRHCGLSRHPLPATENHCETCFGFEHDQETRISGAVCFDDATSYIFQLVDRQLPSCTACAWPFTAAAGTRYCKLPCRGWDERGPGDQHLFDASQRMGRSTTNTLLSRAGRRPRVVRSRCSCSRHWPADHRAFQPRKPAKPTGNPLTSQGCANSDARLRHSHKPFLGNT
jgi:hypothetical protein